MQIRAKINISLLILLVVAFLLKALTGGEFELSFHIVTVIILWSAFFVFIYGKKLGLLGVNAVLIFSAYVVAHELTFHSVPAGALRTYSFLAMIFTLVSILLIQTMSQHQKFLLAVITSFLNLLAWSVPLVYIFYFIQFKVSVSTDAIHAILQTNFHEAIGFIDNYFGFQWVLLILVFSTVSCYGMFIQVKNPPQKIKAGPSFLFLLIFFIILYVNIDEAHIIQHVYSNVSAYQEELAKFRELRAARGSAKSLVTANKSDRNETYVVVIGESLNKTHMGIYGYPRNTTPLLQELRSRGELLLFRNAYSIHTLSMSVLSLALTEANESNKKNYFESVSVLEALESSSVETWWITNQMLYGLYDNVVTVLAKDANHMIVQNKNIGLSNSTRQHDGELVKHLQQSLQTDSGSNRVVFVHLMGSHWPYCERYPIEFKRFDGILEANIFGSLAEVDWLPKYLNCYDNSVLYNDFVVASMLESLKKASGVSGFLYFADHSEDVITMRAHHSDKFSYAMTQIPMLAWFSEPYIKRYPDKYHALVAGQEELFSNDFIYDTLLGVIGIQTENYEPNHDLSNSRYSLDPADTMILEGTKTYSNPDNEHYQQSNSLRGLKQAGLLSKTGISNVDTMGKFSYSMARNIRNIHVKSRLNEDNVLIVGNPGGKLELQSLLATNPPGNEPLTMLVELGWTSRSGLEALSSSLHMPKSNQQIILALPFEFWQTMDSESANLPIIIRVDNENLEMALTTSHLLEERFRGILADSLLYPRLRGIMDQVPEKLRIPIYIQDEIILKDSEFLPAIQKNTYWSDPEVRMILVEFSPPYEMKPH